MVSTAVHRKLLFQKSVTLGVVFLEMGLEEIICECVKLPSSLR